MKLPGLCVGKLGHDRIFEGRFHDWTTDVPNGGAKVDAAKRARHARPRPSSYLPFHAYILEGPLHHDWRLPRRRQDDRRGAPGAAVERPRAEGRPDHERPGP